MLKPEYFVWTAVAFHVTECMIVCPDSKTCCPFSSELPWIFHYLCYRTYNSYHIVR